MLKTLFFIAVFAASAGVASAQLLPGLGGTVGDTVPNTLGAARDTTQGAVNTATETLRNARETASRALVRDNRAVIDTDNHGFPVVRREVVAIEPTEAALTAARSRGFSIGETVQSRELGLTVVVLTAPTGMSTRRALDLLRQLDPHGAYDYNHIYLGAGPAHSEPKQMAQSHAGAANGVRVGLIDSGIDASHPAFAGTAIEQRGFAGPRALADTHGTAVASLIVHADPPGAALYVADVYGGQPTGGGAVAIVSAMSWLAQSRVSVINVSLVGPTNRALEAAIRAAVARGIVVVAAVGNDGPSAPPLYPASYPGVIGVTGVDGHNRVLPEAGRGPQVDFAAPGSDMAAAAANGRYQSVRGTSFAAPIVAGLIAREMQSGSAASAEAALTHEAVDLGARGADRVYGAGLVGGDLRGAMTLARR